MCQQTTSTVISTIPTLLVQHVSTNDQYCHFNKTYITMISIESTFSWGGGLNFRALKSVTIHTY